MGSARPAFCTEVTDFIRGDTTCPDPQAVEAEVFKLTSPQGRAAHLQGARVRVFDAGDDYGVEIEKDDETYRKSYDDPARACDQRVRVVAVTVVMILIPPDLSAEPPAEVAPAHPDHVPASTPEGAAEPRSETQAPRAAATKPEASEETREASEPSGPSAALPPSLQLEAGAWFQHSISNSEVPRIAAWGGELLGALGTARVAGLLAVSAGGSSDFDLGELRASMSEATARAGARLLWPAPGMTLAFDAAFVVARRRVSAEAPSAAEAGAAWELGGSAGANLAIDVWRRVAPVVGLRLNVFPVPSELEAAPRGTIGTLPTFWLAAHAGLRFGL